MRNDKHCAVFAHVFFQTLFKGFAFDNQNPKWGASINQKSVPSFSRFCRLPKWWFSKWGVKSPKHLNHISTHLKHRFPGPIPALLSPITGGGCLGICSPQWCGCTLMFENHWHYKEVTQPADISFCFHYSQVFGQIYLLLHYPTHIFVQTSPNHNFDKCLNVTLREDEPHRHTV